MNILNINKESFEKEIGSFGGTVLIDFYSPDCAPCRTMNPVIESVADKAGNEIKVCKINVREEKDLAEKFGIMSIPTLVVMKNGEIVNKMIGVLPKNEILSAL